MGHLNYMTSSSENVTFAERFFIFHFWLLWISTIVIHFKGVLFIRRTFIIISLIKFFSPFLISTENVLQRFR